MIQPNFEDQERGVQLYCGDCLKILPHLSGIDAVVTDPPYGLGEDGGACRTRGAPGYCKFEKRGWDKEPPPVEAFKAMLQMSRAQIIWGGNFFTDKLPVSRGWLYWDKLMGGDFSDGELAWTSLDIALRKFVFCNKGNGKEHPTQKPIQLICWCLRFIPEFPTILDPYMGSGTTGIACLRTGRRFVGIEIDRKYFEIAKERIQRELAQLVLL